MDLRNKDQVACIADGAKLLDQKCPGWERKLNLEQFRTVGDRINDWNCVIDSNTGLWMLNQIFGSETAAFKHLGILGWIDPEESMSFGFEILDCATLYLGVDDLAWPSRKEHANFHALWQKEIEDRLHFAPYSYV